MSDRPMAGPGRPAWRRGFTLIEVMITLAIVAILVSVALPSYQEYVRRSSREAAQSELVELAGIQEKIFLNSSAYATSVTSGYTGRSTGGLGTTSGKTRDGKYTLSLSVSGATYTLTATPVTGTTQAGNGNLTIASSGNRTWGSKTW